MALKGDRSYNIGAKIDTFMDTTAERGFFVVYTTAGSGTNLDDSANVVAVPTGQEPSGTKPAGLLLNDVVDLDLTRQHLNQYKDEVQVGSKVTILRVGEVTTDALEAGITPTAGDKAYYNVSGQLTNVAPTGVAAADKIGDFRGSVDADGYIKIDVNM